MHNDIPFWSNLKWPAAPNQNDINIYQTHCTGDVLLLGSTYQLLPLCNEAWDLEPKYIDAKIHNKNWLDLDCHWDTIISDGFLCFTKEFTEEILPVVLSHCNKLITRSFLNPNWKTTYATWFPKVCDLNPQPHEIPVSEIYTFYIWNKNQQY